MKTMSKGTEENKKAQSNMKLKTLHIKTLHMFEKHTLNNGLRDHGKNCFVKHIS